MNQLLRISYVHFFILSLTNAIESLKSEFLADSGIIMPKFAG